MHLRWNTSLIVLKYTREKNYVSYLHLLHAPGQTLQIINIRPFRILVCISPGVLSVTFNRRREHSLGKNKLMNVTILNKNVKSNNLYKSGCHGVPQKVSLSKFIFYLCL
jgi:hypothetical protein